MRIREGSQRLVRHVSWYGGVVFSSAFLLFAIEPMAGKRLLPYFGGSSAVWATGLVFFTATLCAGYGYAYLLSRFGGRRQPLVHAALLVLAAGLLLGMARAWHGMYPPLAELASGSGAPAVGVLFALALGIGVPFLLLSATGPLLQFWYGAVSGREPYRLYALSNTGSLLALLSYPLLIEPNLALQGTESLWIACFVAFALACAALCVGIRDFSVPAPLPVSSSRASLRAAPLWVAFGALPAFLLVATTTQITQTIAPVPLLWIIPLALYLISLILAFRGLGRSLFMPLILLGACAYAYRHVAFWPSGIDAQLGGALFLLFTAGLFSHAWAYALRPAKEQLPLFYLLFSFGGALGTFAAALLSPALFPDFWEFRIGLFFASALGLFALPEAFFPRILEVRKIPLARIVLVLGVAALFSRAAVSAGGTEGFVASRDFYGAVRVRFEPAVTALMHGATLHGVQPTERASRYLPTSYYVPGSGAGRAILYAQETRKKEGLRTAVIGLGTGSLAAYCRPGDAYIFYEIDPQVAAIARSYFSYTHHCAGAQVRIGDGRLLIAGESQAGESADYDVLLMDAFSDDTVPVHLLTLEAMRLYASRLRPVTGLMAIHTSNRYLDLPPVIFKEAAALGMGAMIVQDDGSSNPYGSPSQWVLLAKNPRVFEHEIFANSNGGVPDFRNAPLWTDDYASIAQVAALPGLR